MKIILNYSITVLVDSLFSSAGVGKTNSTQSCRLIKKILSILVLLFISFNNQNLNSESWEFAPPFIQPGRYEGPMEEIDTKTGRYRGMLIARVAKVKKDGSLIIWPASEAGYRKLILKIVKDDHDLLWHMKIDSNTYFTAKGATWAPNIFVVSVLKKKNGKIIWGARYFFAPVKPNAGK